MFLPPRAKCMCKMFSKMVINMDASFFFPPPILNEKAEMASKKNKRRRRRSPVGICNQQWAVKVCFRNHACLTVDFRKWSCYMPSTGRHRLLTRFVLSFPFSLQNPAAAADVETASSRMFASNVLPVYNMMVYGFVFRLVKTCAIGWFFR